MPSQLYTYRILVANLASVRIEKLGSRSELLGEKLGSLRFRKNNRSRLRAFRANALSNELTSAQLQQFGEALFDVLFDPVLRHDFFEFFKQARREGFGLRIELDFDSVRLPELAALPWELMRFPESAGYGVIWLGTVPSMALSRRRLNWAAATPFQLRIDEPLRVALAIAAPQDLGPVAYEEVQEAIQDLATTLRGGVELLPVVQHATASGVDALLAMKPHIFHFIGHGRLQDEQQQAVGQIALEDALHRANWIDADYFSELLNQHGPGLVVLQACESGALSISHSLVGVASHIVQQGIPVVVAMQYEISNSTALRFALGFYKSLVAGEPIDVSTQVARRTISLGPSRYDTRDFAAPVLFTRVRDGHLFSRQPGSNALEPSQAAASNRFSEIMRARPMHFVGRTEEIGRIESLIIPETSEATTIAVVGMGGVGKTALIDTAIHKLQRLHFPGGILLADFPSHQGDALQILNAWAYLCDEPALVTLSSPQIRVQRTSAAIREHISKFGRMLAVFDDVRSTQDEPWLEGAHLLRQALPATVPLVITTRHAPIAQSLRAQHLMELMPLDPDDGRDLVSELIDSVAPEVASEIADLTGNLPLAIEIASMQVMREGLDTVVGQLRDPQSRIDVLDLGLNRKQDSVVTTFEISYRSLDNASKKMFQILGAFSQGLIFRDWILALAQRLLAPLEADEGRSATQTLSDLHGRSLVQRIGSWYRLHPLLQSYSTRLLSRDSVLAARARFEHHKYFLEVVREYEHSSADIDSAYSNVMLAIQYAYSEKLWTEILELTQRLSFVGKYQHRRGMWSDALLLLNYSLEASEAIGDKSSQSRFLCEIGMHQRELGKYTEASHTLESSIKLSREINDAYGLAIALANLAHLSMYRRETAQAEALVDEAAHFSLASGNRIAFGKTRLTLARLRLASGDLASARTYCEECIRLAREADDDQLLTYGLRAMGETYEIEGDAGMAFHFLSLALVEAKRTEDFQAQAYVLRGIGDAHRRIGELLDAAAAYKEGERLCRGVNDSADLSGLLCSLGETYLALSNLEDAAKSFEEAASYAAEARWSGRSKFGIAQVEYIRGNRARAEELALDASIQLRAIAHRDARVVEDWFAKHFA